MTKSKVKSEKSKGPRDVHVVADPKRRTWTVKRGSRTLSRHRTQTTAVRAAERTARRHRVDLVTHGRDGKIRSKDSYGNESARVDREH